MYIDLADFGKQFVADDTVYVDVVCKALIKLCSLYF